jgi:hypothetical protein
MPEIKGSDVDKITMIEIVREIFIDLLRGYPVWRYYGIIEGRFKENLGIIVRDKLKDDGLINVEEKDGRIYYWLTPKGVQLASSFTIRKKVKDYGLIGLVLVGMTIVIGLAQLFLSYFQNPIPLS